MNMTATLKKLIHTACLAGMAGTAAASNADDFPTRPVTMVVGYAPGGATDVLARQLARAMSAELGQTVVVENKAGANSNIAAEYVARSKKDGYTVYISTIGNTVNQSLYDNLNFNFTTDFEAVGLVATISNVLVLNPQNPIKTVAEYIAYAKANPGKLTCASSGVGSSIHMSCELFKVRTGVDLLHVPYRGGGPAVTDLLGGQVDSMFDNIPSALNHIKAEKLRPLATMTAARAANLPDVPTFAEEGIQDFVAHSWFALSAPAGTPPSIVKKLNTALNDAFKHPEVVQFYEKNGYNAPAHPNSPEELKTYIQSETDKWASVVKAANLKAN